MLSGSPLETISPLFVKQAFPCVGPSVLAIINTGLSSDVVPLSFKHVVVEPQKTNLHKTVMDNFRPVSKLPFYPKSQTKLSTHNGNLSWSETMCF